MLSVGDVVEIVSRDLVLINACNFSRNKEYTIVDINNLDAFPYIVINNEGKKMPLAEGEVKLVSGKMNLPDWF